MERLPTHVQRNLRVANEVFAVIEKLQYGEVSFKFSIHNCRVTNWVAQGTRRYKYRKDEQKQAVLSILKRIKEGEDRQRTEDLVFVVKRKSGKIEEVEQLSDIARNYEALENN